MDEMKVDGYFKNISKLQRDINRENINSFKTAYLNDLIEYEAKLTNNLPENLRKIFNFYKLVLINHICEIRFDDAFDVFMAGFKNGLEHDRFLKNKYNNL